MIGSSDGKQYEDEFNLEIGLPISTKKEGVGAPEKATGKTRVSQDAGDQGIPALERFPDIDHEEALPKELGNNFEHLYDKLESLKDKVKPGNLLRMYDEEGNDYYYQRDDKYTPGFSWHPKPPGKTSELNIDRDHHVPLVASALTDKDGQMYGMAIDHRIPSKPEYEKHLWNHEAYENDYMNDLVKNGMSSKDAYHKAHDWSTARESAAVTAEFGEKGLEDYKQHWRDASSVAAEPTDKPRHPDAHTTKHGLDEAELGSSWQDKLMHVREAITGQKQPTKEELASGKVQIPSIQSAIPQAVGMGMQAQGMAPALFGGVMAKTAASAEKWFAGADSKPRFEIPDVNSKLTLNKTKAALKSGAKFTTLGDVLEHKELYKAYPELKDLKVFHDKDMSLGSAYFDARGPSIVVGPQKSEAELHSTLLHEIQHAIQFKEGFSFGTTPKAMVPAVAKAMVKKKIDLSKVSNDQINETVFDAYSHVAGEVEARNVQTRKDFNDLDRYFRSPESTEDVPRYRQLNAPKSGSASSSVIFPKNLPEGFTMKPLGKTGSYTIQNSEGTHYAIAKTPEEALAQFWQSHPRLAPNAPKTEEEAYRQFDSATRFPVNDNKK